MRKITLFAVSAIAASSAFAVQPVALGTLPVAKKASKVEKTFINPKYTGNVQSRADEPAELTGDEAATLTGTNYVPVGSYFLGLTQDLRPFRGKFGFTPGYGQLGFYNFTSSETNAWSWSTQDATSETAEEQNFTASTKNLVIDLEPAMIITDVTLKSASEYSDNVFYCPGRDPFWWGLYGGAEEDETPVEASKAGVTPSHNEQNDFFTALDMTYKKAAGNNYQPNGTPSSWLEIFRNPPKAAALKGFGEILPGLSQPYQLTSVYLWVDAITTKATPLTVKVYALDEEGRIDTKTVLGDGVAILPEGEFPGPTLLFNLNQVDELGLPTAAPVCVGPNGAYVEVSGFDAETVEEFSPVMNGGVTVPVTNVWDEVWDIVYPQYTSVSLMVTTQDDEERTGIYSMPFVFGASGDESVVTRPTNYGFYYNVNFPIVMNAETGEGTFPAVIPNEGGEALVGVASTEDIEQLIADELITSEATADWFTYEVGVTEVESATITTVTVKADALPAGETGRYGEIKFTGYACDFTVTVTQGESGINSVVANGQGAAEFYDLQGRKLNAAPAKGLYIERNGSAAATKLAR